MFEKLRKILSKEGNKNMEFNIIADEWLQYRRNMVKESTYYEYMKIVEKHLKPKFGNEVTYYWQNSDYPYFYGSNGVKGNLGVKHTSGFFWWNGNNWKSSSRDGVSSESITTLKSNYYEYLFSDYLDINSTKFGLICDEVNYWVSDSYTDTHAGCVHFGLFKCTVDGEIIGGGLFRSYGFTGAGALGVKVVINLSIDFELN